MKAVVLQDNLKKGISVVERVSSKSLNLPALNNILISAEKNFLNLAATDLEVGINWWSLVKTEKEGKIAVPAKLLAGFIGLLPNKPVTLEVKNMSLQIDCQNYRTVIKGFDPEEFPIIPNINDGDNITLKADQLCRSLGQVVSFCSATTSRPEISGVYLLIQKKLITLAATDSFRLGEKKLFLQADFPNLSQDHSIIIPQRAAKEIINIFGGGEGDLKLYFSPNQILLESMLSGTDHPQVRIISRLLEGDFPPYQEIIPTKSETKITLPRNELINQVKMASLFGSKINELKLKINPKEKKIELLSQNPDLGEHQSFLEGEVDGKPIEISFNYRFLLDGLLSIDSPEVVLELAGPEGPGVLKPKNKADYLYLAMPIKTN